MRWLRGRRRTARPREKLFVGRWGIAGPELYVVGGRIRRLSAPRPDAVSYARRILAEVMYCRPGTRLARAFAAAQLEPLPADGFVLSASDVEAWLNSRHWSVGR